MLYRKSAVYVKVSQGLMEFVLKARNCAVTQKVAEINKDTQLILQKQGNIHL